MCPTKHTQERLDMIVVRYYENYRFLVTQNNELLMYDSKGKIVKGFKYEKSSDIIYSPKHYRIKNKDIIVVKTGKGLKILNRRGKIRIKIKDNIKFSNTDVFRLNNYLICTSEKGNLVQIDMNGSVSTRKLNLSNNHKINSMLGLVSTFADELNMCKTAINNIGIDL